MQALCRADPRLFSSVNRFVDDVAAVVVAVRATGERGQARSAPLAPVESSRAELCEQDGANQIAAEQPKKALV